MTRFLFLFVIGLMQISSVYAATVSEVANDQFYPFYERATGRTSGKILLAGVLSVALTYSTHPQEPLVRLSEKNERFYETLTSGVGSLAVIGTQYFFDQDPSHYQSHMRGLVYTAATVFALKALSIGRRPGDNFDYPEFPSSPAALSFMSATSLSYAYGWPAALFAFPIATYTTLELYKNHSHRASDDLAGAFIGVWLGRASFYKTADQEEHSSSSLKDSNEDNFQIVPFVISDQIGTYMAYSF